MKPLLKKALILFLTLFTLPAIGLIGISLLLHKTINEQVDSTLTYTESIKGALGFNADSADEKEIKSTFHSEAYRHIHIYFKEDFRDLLPIAKESLDWAIERNEQLFGEAYAKPVDLFVFDDYTELTKLTGLESVDGTYSDFHKTIAIHYEDKQGILEREPMPLTNLQRIIAHEYTHYALNRKVKNLHQLPLWFIEGLSEYVENDRREVEYLQFATLPFQGLVTPEGWAQGLEVAGADPYDQSYFAIKFLTDKYGEWVINDILASLKDTENFDASFKEVTGLSTEKLQKEYLTGIAEDSE